MAPGSSHFDWHADVSFFELFENSEILGADLSVKTVIHNHGVTLDAECQIVGTVTTSCDRCLEDLVIPVETSFEETYVPESDELDLSQDVYDFVCTALPIQRVHEDGGCNPETTKYLSIDDEDDNNI